MNFIASALGRASKLSSGKPALLCSFAMSSSAAAFSGSMLSDSEPESPSTTISVSVTVSVSFLLVPGLMVPLLESLAWQPSYELR